MIQVSEVDKWRLYCNGKQDFPENNNLTHFYISHSAKKKSLFGSAEWQRGEKFETNYKWDAQRGISYHQFQT